MPQLTLAPWLSILMFSWLIFLTILPTKVLAHLFPNEPAPQGTEKSQTGAWNWPWH